MLYVTIILLKKKTLKKIAATEKAKTLKNWKNFQAGVKSSASELAINVEYFKGYVKLAKLNN